MGDADLDLYEDVDDFNIKVKYIVFCLCFWCAIFGVVLLLDTLKVSNMMRCH